MADLVVDLNLLETTAGALGLLIEEFTNASKIVTAHEADIGDATLNSALQSFASDWQVHREKLVSSMQAVYKMATESHKAYISTDDKLAQDLQKGSHG